MKSRLRVANGGQIELYAPDVSIASDLSARSGRIAAGNVYEGIDRDAMIPAVANASARLIVAPGVLLDVSGAWVNARRDPATAGDLAYRNGGQIVLRGTEDVRVGKGSVLNADSGAAIAASGKLIGGRGGDVNVELALSPDGSAPRPVASASRSMARPMPMA